MTARPERETELSELVVAYCRYGTTNREEYFWAWERVGDIVRGAVATDAWDVAVALVRSAPDDQLDYIAAGPLEDFIYRHGSALIDRIEGEAARDSRFRDALGRVWLVADDIPQDVLARLQSATDHRIVVRTQAEINAANEGLSW